MDTISVGGHGTGGGERTGHRRPTKEEAGKAAPDGPRTGWRTPGREFSRPGGLSADPELKDSSSRAKEGPVGQNTRRNVLEKPTSRPESKGNERKEGTMCGGGRDHHPQLNPPERSRDGGQ